MDDVQMARELLENAGSHNGVLSHSDIVFGLRNLLKMKYYPVAVKFFFDEEELANFKRGRICYRRNNRFYDVKSGNYNL